MCLDYAVSASVEVGRALFPHAHDLSSDRSTLIMIERARFGDDIHAIPDEPTPTIHDLVALVDAVDLRVIDPERVQGGLRASVDSARYWQDHDGEDAVAALPELHDALVRIAEAILAAPVAVDWDEPSAEQWAVDWRVPEDAAPLPSDPPTLLAEWDRELHADEDRSARERPSDASAPHSGTWWSVPQSILHTRGTVRGALELVEDSLGWDVATIIPVRGRGRILEIHGADDWASLCRAYPCEVSASRRHDWYRVTGRAGRWVIPDWPRVAEEWDAVHLTTLGYLRAATTLIEVDDERASVIAGWAPDSTLWLTDSAREWAGPRQHWVRATDQETWTRVDAD